MFNKRGQEGITLGTLLLIILGVVVVVVIIVGATSGFDFVFSKFKIAPGQGLEAKTQACIIAVKSSLRADYCDTFSEIEINGQSQYVNCAYPAVESNVKKAEGVNSVLSCDGNNKAVVNFCAGLVKSGKTSDSIRVNGELCASYTCESMGGQALPEGGSCVAGKTKYTKGFLGASESNVCCL